MTLGDTMNYMQNNSTGSDGSTGFFGGIANWWTGNTDWERQLMSQQNQFAFNAREAEKSRQWQEHMSNSAYQRAVIDATKAGINPYAVLSSGRGASTPNGAVASGGSGSSSGRPSGPGVALSSAVSLAGLAVKGVALAQQAKQFNMTLEANNALEASRQAFKKAQSELVKTRIYRNGYGQKTGSYEEYNY